MLKTRVTLALGLIALFLLSACGPAAPSEAEATQPGLAAAPAAETITPAPTTAPAQATATPPAVSSDPTPIAVATSRGPALEATDPAMVQLASGGLQLVEFFRFT